MDWDQGDKKQTATITASGEEMRLTPFHFNYLHPEDRAQLVARRKFLAEQSQGEVRRRLHKLTGNQSEVEWQRWLEGLTPQQYWRNQRKYGADWYSKELDANVQKKGQIGFIQGLKRDQPSLLPDQQTILTLLNGSQGGRYRKRSPQTKYIQLPPIVHEKILQRPVYIQVPRYIAVPAEPEYIPQKIHPLIPTMQHQVQTDPFKPETVVKVVQKIVNKYIERTKEVQVIKRVPVRVEVEKIVREVKQIVKYVDKNEKLESRIAKERQLRFQLSRQLQSINKAKQQIKNQKKQLDAQRYVQEREITIQLQIAAEKIERLQSMKTTVKELQNYLKDVPQKLKQNIVADMRIWQVSLPLQEKIKYHPGARQIQRALKDYEQRLFDAVKKKEEDLNKKISEKQSVLSNVESKAKELEQQAKALVDDAAAKAEQLKAEAQRFKQLMDMTITQQNKVSHQGDNQPSNKEYKWVSIGSNDIVVSVYQTYCWIGTKVTKDGRAYFTHQSVKLQKKWWPFIAKAWELIKDRNIQPDQKVIAPVGKSTVCMIKDRYKGAVYVGLRHFVYYSGEVQPTRYGFNLKPDQFRIGMEQWQKNVK